MDKRKAKRLEAAGWHVGSAWDFLELTDAEAALFEMKVVLGAKLRSWRLRAGLSQKALAHRILSSQSRVAKMEAGDPGVTLDLLVQGALAAGASQAEVAKAMAPRRRLAAG